MDCGPPGSSVHRILQARIWKQVAISFSKGSSRTRDQTWVSRTAGRLYQLSHQELDTQSAAKLLQSCPTLCDPIDSSPPGSPSLGFLRQEHWSGLPFPSPMHERKKCHRQNYNHSSSCHIPQLNRIFKISQTPILSLITTQFFKKSSCFCR